MPQITESAVYQALGLEEPAANAGTGANAQEPAQPAQEPATDTGANEQGPAQPAQEPETEPTGTDSGEQDPGGDEPAGQDPDKGSTPMDAKTRRENAARRRREEQQAAIDAAVQAAIQAERSRENADWSRFFETSGLKNSITGQPIRTREEYMEWQQAWQTQQMQQKLAAGELTPEMIQQLISQNPVMQQAQQLLDQNSQAQEQARQQAENARIQEEITQIGKLDPNIQSIEDLLNMPEQEFTAFKGFVDKGYSYYDSYRLSHMDQIVNRRAQQAREQAMANERGKSHLRSSGNAQGTGPVSVPPEILRQYRLFNPKATDAEIQAHYNKSIKK